MKKVTVLRLSGCGHCKDLIGALDKAGVKYTSIDADENGEFADKIEEIVNTEVYPIVIIEVERLFPFYIFRAQTYEEMGEASLDNAVKIGTMSIESMVEIILNLL